MIECIEQTIAFVKAGGSTDTGLTAGLKSVIAVTDDTQGSNNSEQ